MCELDVHVSVWMCVRVSVLPPPPRVSRRHACLPTPVHPPNTHRHTRNKRTPVPPRQPVEVIADGREGRGEHAGLHGGGGGVDRENVDGLLVVLMRCERWWSGEEEGEEGREAGGRQRERLCAC